MDKLNEIVYLDMDVEPCNDLAQAICEQDSDSFNVLVQETVQVEGRDSQGYSVLHQAARANVVEFLAPLLERFKQLKLSVDDNENLTKTTPLHLAVQAGDIQSAVALVDAGASPTARDVNGLDCLHIAAKNNHALLTFYFLKHKISVNTRDNHGRTPLHWAAYKDSGWVVSLLVKNGDIDLDAVDVSKSTALHYAAKCGKEEATRLLLEAGAIITPVNAAGQQPVDVAVDAANQLVASLLRVGARRGRQFVAPDLSDKPWARHVMFALPLVLLTSVSSTLARYGWFAWQTACCFLLVVVGLARVQKYMWPERASRSRFPAGVCWATVTNWFFVHWFLYIPALPDYMLEHCVVIALEVVLALTLAYSCESDPGVITSRGEFDSVAAIHAQVKQGLQESQFCSLCEVRRPIRSRHCRLCGICIARYDHHCAWTDNCVGDNNHRIFVVFCITSNIILFWLQRLAYLYFCTFPDTPTSLFSKAFILSAIAHSPYAFYSASFWGLYVQFNHATVLKNQLSHIAVNETLYERARKNANRPLFPPPLDDKPFDLGLEQNVKQWARFPGYAIDWYNIFSIDRYARLASSRR